MMFYLEARRIISTGNPRTGLVCGQDTIYRCQTCGRLFCRSLAFGAWNCWTCIWKRRVM